MSDISADLSYEERAQKVLVWLAEESSSDDVRLQAASTLLFEAKAIAADLSPEMPLPELVALLTKQQRKKLKELLRDRAQ